MIGVLVFPRFQLLDAAGPISVFEIATRYAGVPPSITVLAETPGPVRSSSGVEMLAFLRRQAEGAKYVTSVCTGSLVLGAAGLLKGYRAATHWTAMDFLKEFGATPTHTRVCIDRNRITGGGVTAGIDFALTLVSHLVDRRTAEAIQLRIEYNPAPPFNAGSPDTAPAEIVALFRERIAPSQARRGEMIKRAAARLA